jgi:trimeric autotransporter adhesin
MRMTSRLWGIAVAGMLAVASLPAAAQQVGVASGVNPSVSGTPPGLTMRTIMIGQQVVYNEHITTSASGQAQILFLDQSTMTIGPNSDLTIDRFVYDPNTGTGQLAMTATKGVMRYVGGVLSKHENAVTLRTNTATIGIRGGIVLVRAG